MRRRNAAETATATPPLRDRFRLSRSMSPIFHVDIDQKIVKNVAVFDLRENAPNFKVWIQ